MATPQGALKSFDSTPSRPNDRHLSSLSRTCPPATAPIRWEFKVREGHVLLVPHLPPSPPQPPRSSRSFPAPGQVTTIGPVLEAGLGRLHFAGEHCCPAFVGYMEGALQSGVRIAKKLATRDGLVD